jgi:predicted flap endonuclease-1-like 5' DNA nuclease
MGILETIKSLLGLDGSSEDGRRRDTSVTVERDTRAEPDAETERAVKESEPAATETDAAASTGSTVDETAEGAEAAEPAEAAGPEPSDMSTDVESAAPEARDEPIEDAEELTPDEAEAAAAEEPADADEKTDEAEAAAAEEAADADEETEEAAEEADEATAESDASQPVENVKGIGPAYAERLAEAGVHTIADLAAADAAELAEQTSLSEKRITRWVERASGYD